MDPLSISASIIALIQLTTNVIDCLNDIRDAPKQCQRCSLEIANVLGLLVNLKGRVKQAELSDPWFEQVLRLRVRDGPLEQYEQSLHQLQKKTQIGAGTHKMRTRLMWTFTKGEVEEILKRIERLKSLISIALEMDHFTLSQGITERLAALDLDMASTSMNTTLIRDTQIDQQHQAVLNWLTMEDTSTKLVDIISRRQDGTAQWFLNSVEFQRWKDGVKNTLFCPGIPGAGKTMMAAVAIGHLQQTFQSSDVAIAYLFCSYKARIEQTLRNLHAAILKQLSQLQPELINSLENLRRQCKGGQASPVDIYKALKSSCDAFKKVYLVVDALDEYQEDNERNASRTSFISGLRDLQASADVNILFTSRYIPSITEQFETDSTLEVRASLEDVHRYVEDQLPRLPRCIRKDPQLQAIIVEKITHSAQGMFLLAQLHVKSLYDNKNRKEVLDTLQRMSKPLDEAYNKAYDEAIERIESQSEKHSLLAKRALCWISHAKRQLTTEELECALAIEPNEKYLDVDNIYDIEEVVSVCAGLVTIDNESQIVRLVHFTTQEYFKRVRMKWYPEAQKDIAIACLTYLGFDTFQSGSCDTYQLLRRRIDENNFFRYAVSFWAEHVDPVQLDVAEQVLRLLSSTSIIDCISQGSKNLECSPWGGLQSFHRDQTAVHLIAQHGLTKLMGVALADDELVAEVGLKDSHGKTSLHLAASNGHEVIVAQLLATGKVEIDSKNYHGETPLNLAARSGHDLVVTQLLMTGKVEIDSKNNLGYTPLFLAGKSGHAIVVTQLLATGKVDVNHRDNYGMTTLSRAAVKGHEAVVTQLLATGNANIDSKDEYGNTPLNYAAADGHEGIVFQLLATGKADINSKNGAGHTPLLCAVRYGHKRLVSRLLSTGKVDVNPKDGDGNTPLSCAVENGHEEMVSQLLMNKADFNSKDMWGRTPLALAIEKGYEGIVSQLLASKADVNSRDTFSNTPLSLAVKKGHEGIVSRLLATEADVNSRDTSGNTPLSLAVMKGHEGIVSRLLATEADVNSKDKRGRTPLIYALENGHEGIALLLQEAGANFH